MKSWTIIQSILVFFLVFVTDAVWTINVQAAAKNRALTAAFASAILVLVGGVNIWLLVYEPWLLIPEVAGAFCGTYVIIRYVKKSNIFGPPS